MLSVVMPVRNEAATIRATLDELYAAFLRKLDKYEVLLMEDASTDNTAQVIVEAEKDYPNLSAYCEPQPIRYRRSVQRGIARAKGEFVLVMDSDGQIDPADIWQMLSLIPHADMVSAEKFPRCDPILRIFVSRTFDWLSDLVLGVSMRDCNFGCKLTRAGAAKQIAAQCGVMGDSFNAEMLLRFVYSGYRVVQVRVRHRRREGASVGLPPLRAIPTWIKAITGLMKLRREFTCHKNLSLSASA